MSNNIPELAAQIVSFLRDNPELIIVEDGKAKKVYVRILDSGMIGKDTHAELDAARADLTAASNDAETIAALKKFVTAHDAIIDGRKEGGGEN